MPARTKYTSVDDYIADQSNDAREKLETLRNAILEAAPGAEEVISYNMPAMRLDGLLVWYAAFKSHIGFYPRVSAMVAFQKELSKFKNAKGSVQFPMDQPLPIALVKKMVKFRVKENKEEAAAKKKR